MIAKQLESKYFFAGKKYGKLIKDCCDCDVLQCIDCEPPQAKEELCPNQRPINCYTYEAHHEYAEDTTSCWKPQCLEKPRDKENEVLSTHFNLSL